VAVEFASPSPSSLVKIDNAALAQGAATLGPTSKAKNSGCKTVGPEIYRLLHRLTTDTYMIMTQETACDVLKYNCDPQHPRVYSQTHEPI
jgi:hypothetical protein